MMQRANLDSAERARLEQAIGAATLDRMRGHGSTGPGVHYDAGGGGHASVKQALSSVDSIWQDADLDAVGQDAAGGGSFADAFTRWNMSAAEVTRLERAIGHGILGKLEGGNPSLSDSYASVGGTNADTKRVIGQVEPRWSRWQPRRVSDALG